MTFSEGEKKKKRLAWQQWVAKLGRKKTGWLSLILGNICLKFRNLKIRQFLPVLQHLAVFMAPPCEVPPSAHWWETKKKREISWHVESRFGANITQSPWYKFAAAKESPRKTFNQALDLGRENASFRNPGISYSKWHQAYINTLKLRWKPTSEGSRTLCVSLLLFCRQKTGAVIKISTTATGKVFKKLQAYQRKQHSEVGSLLT